MKTTIEIFVEDHQVALGHLDRLEKNLDALGQGAPVDKLRAQLEEFAGFLNEALKVHFRQEEEALFPVLGERIGVEGGPIGQMLLEHQQIEEAHRIFQEELEKTTSDAGILIDSGRQIIGLLGPHIAKENNVLFPLAQQVLGPEGLARVDQLTARVQ